MSKVFRASVLLTFTVAAALGCSGQDRRMEPVGTLVAIGGGPVSYRAPQDGTLYVYDDKIERLVYSGPIREGQVFSVDPRNKRLMLDGRIIQDNALQSGDRHRIYLKEYEPTTLFSTSARDRVIVEQGTKSTEYHRANTP